MTRAELVRVRCRIKSETDDAILIYSFDRELDMWLPLSQVEEIHKDPRGDDYLLVSAWIARKCGLPVTSTPKDHDS